MRPWRACEIAEIRGRQRFRLSSTSRASAVASARSDSSARLGEGAVAPSADTSPAQVAYGIGQPGQVRLLARDDVLIGIVDVVIGDLTGCGHVSIKRRKTLLIEFAQQRDQLAWLHVACFSLQLMQTRVQGIAFKRASAIGSPQSRQMP